MDAIIKNGKIEGQIINLYQIVGNGYEHKCAFCRETQDEGWDIANSEEHIHFSGEAFRICNKCSDVFRNYVNDEDNFFRPYFTFKAIYYFVQTPKGLPFLQGSS